MTDNSEETNAGGWWQTIAVTLIAVLTSFGGFWVTIGRHVPTRSEVREMIASDTPYIEDRKLIRSKLDRNDETNRELSKAINSLTVELGEMRAINSVLIDQVTRRRERANNGGNH